MNQIKLDSFLDFHNFTGIYIKLLTVYFNLAWLVIIYKGRTMLNDSMGALGV